MIILLSFIRLLFWRFRRSSGATIDRKRNVRLGFRSLRKNLGDRCPEADEWRIDETGTDPSVFDCAKYLRDNCWRVQRHSESGE